MSKQSKQSRCWYRDYLKRPLDIGISSLSIIFLSWLLLLIAILIKIDSPKEKVLFLQKRSGKNNKVFTIYKFRTMRSEAPHQIATNDFKSAEKYITRIGRFLRKSSLDELPQLFNVIKGDMSLVGPRPLIPAELTVLQLRTLSHANEVLPGITGLAQVKGRDNLDANSKAKYDHEYAKNISFKLDGKIIIKTITDVIQSKNINDGSKTRK